MATPHKFWRIKFTNSSGGLSSGIWLGEVVFKDAGGVDLCTGGTPFASSEHSSGAYGVALAFDKGNVTNGWSSAGGQFPCWVGYEFSSPVDVDAVEITLPNNPSATAGQPTQATTTVEWSDDGTTYTTFPSAFWSGAPANPTYPAGSTLLIPHFEIAGGYVLPGPLFARSGRAPTDFSQPRFVAVQPPQQASRPLALGPGRIAGTLKVLTLPAAREVRLHDRHTGQLLRTTTSAPDGTYSFGRLQLDRRYMVVGLDDTGQPSMKNAAVADMVEAGL